MSRYLSSLLLCIMVVGLAVIYRLSPSNSQNLVALISVLILAYGLFLGFARGRQNSDAVRVLMIMAAPIALISTVLLGNRFVGPTGAACLPVLLLIGGMVAFSSYMRRAVHVDEGDVMIIDRRIGHANRALPAGVYPPLIPGVEEASAVLPAYELTSTVEVEHADTHLLVKPEVISVCLRYRVRDLTLAEREALERTFEELWQKARRRGESRASLIDRLMRPNAAHSLENVSIERREWEQYLVGGAPMSQEEMADRRAFLREATLDRAEAQADAWELFFYPFASYLRLVYHFPNRGIALAKLAREWSEELEVARLRSEFWAELIRRQMGEECDEVVREVIHDARGLVVRNGRVAKNRDGTPRWNYYGPVEISKRREDLIDAILHRLQRRVRRWGIQILDLEIDQVKLTQESIGSRYEPQVMEEEYEDRPSGVTSKAIDAYAAVREPSQGRTDETLAHMIELLVSEIHAAGTNLSEADVRRIVSEVLEEHARLRYDLRDARSGSDSPKH